MMRTVAPRAAGTAIPPDRRLPENGGGDRLPSALAPPRMLHKPQACLRRFRRGATVWPQQTKFTDSGGVGGNERRARRSRLPRYTLEF